jgi:hypothetical protein
MAWENYREKMLSTDLVGNYRELLEDCCPDRGNAQRDEVRTVGKPRPVFYPSSELLDVDRRDHGCALVDGFFCLCHSVSQLPKFERHGYIQMH